MDGHAGRLWSSWLQSGQARLVVGSSDSERVSGVRDGFERFRTAAGGPALDVVVESRPEDEDTSWVPLTDEECLGRARQRAHALHESLGNPRSSLSVCPETGLDSFVPEGDSADVPPTFLRCWVALVGADLSSDGASASLRIPPELLEGSGRAPGLGSRRRGGLVGGLTGGAENRRSVTAQATFQALASLFHGVLSSPGA
ncbi:MAG: DUF84 family protein [Acidobacteriota bacterium]